MEQQFSYDFCLQYQVIVENYNDKSLVLKFTIIFIVAVSTLKPLSGESHHVKILRKVNPKVSETRCLAILHDPPF